MRIQPQKPHSARSSTSTEVASNTKNCMSLQLLYDDPHRQAFSLILNHRILSYQIVAREALEVVIFLHIVNPFDALMGFL